MADGSADFTLRLHNQVSGPARKMSTSIRGLSSDLRDKQKSFSKGESEFQKKLRTSRRMADTAHRQDLRAMAAKRTAAVRLAAVNAKLRQRNAARGAREDTAGRSVAVGAIGVSAVMVAGITAGVGLLAANFVSATIAAVDFAQRSKTALASILKDGTLAAQQFREVRMEAGGLGLDVTDTVDQFKMLANSGFKVPMARDLVRMSADLQALTGSSESASFALRAISQIKMKGRLQAEEITGQLAEHGVSADEVYKVLGKTLGKTREEILKMQKAGDLSADVAIPAILQAVRNQLGVEQSGGFAMKINASSVGGMWRTLKGQVQNAFVSLGEQVGPGITKAFGSIMASIQTAIASPQMQALGSAVVGLFNTISGLVGQTDFATLLRGAAETLSTELTSAATFIRDHGAEIRQSFMLFVNAMVTGLKAAADFFKPFVAFATSGFGQFLFTPLNETFGGGDEAAVKESKARMAANSRGAASAASQAGAASLSKSIVVNLSGDTIISGVDHDGSPEGAAGAFTDRVRRDLLKAMQDGA